MWLFPGTMAGGIVRQDNAKFFDDPYNHKSDPLGFYRDRQYERSRGEMGMHVRNACVIL